MSYTYSSFSNSPQFLALIIFNYKITRKVQIWSTSRLYDGCFFCEKIKWCLDGGVRSSGHEHWHFHLVLGGHFITNDNYNLRFIIIVPRARLRPSVMLTSVWLLVTICKQFEANYQCFNDSSFPPVLAWRRLIPDVDVMRHSRHSSQPEQYPGPVTTPGLLMLAPSGRK